MHFSAGYFTDIGSTREKNEDALYAGSLGTGREASAFAVVCDGMGGYSHGEKASAEVVSSLKNWFENEFLNRTDWNEKSLHEEWQSIISSCNEKIRNESQRNGEITGTTCTALLLMKERWYGMNIGDSRTYFLSSRGISLLTKDDSQIQKELDEGLITPDDAKNDSRNNVLTKSIGIRKEAAISFQSGIYDNHSRFILCSDGFYHCMDRADWDLVRREDVSSLMQRLSQLVNNNISHGETDNITCVFLQADEENIHLPEVSFTLCDGQYADCADGTFQMICTSSERNTVKEKSPLIINDTYEILDQIGAGGMSKVYRARHMRLNTIWAVKQIRRKPGVKFDFLAESNILKKLSHPMLVRIVDILSDDPDYIYIVEDYVDGITLKQLLTTQKCIPENTAVKWFKELCDVLNYLHTQKPYPIIYRDMKPGNIMLQSDGTLKLIDFGIAREYKSEKSGDTTLAGTHGYAAPEQFSSNSQTDARTDIYSLGMTIYHLVTGKSPLEEPFGMVPARELNPDISVGLETILKKCTQLRSEDRYQNVKDLLFDLNHMYLFEEDYKRFLKRKKRRFITVVSCFAFGGILIAGGIFVHQKEMINAYENLIKDASNQDYSTAIERLKEAEQKLPENTDAYVSELSLNYQNGKYTDAVNLFESLQKKGMLKIKEDDDAYKTAAQAYMNAGDYAAAEKIYKQLYDDNLLNEQDKLKYISVLAYQNDYDDAEKIISALGSSDQLTAEYSSGILAYMQGNSVQASECLEKVCSNASDASLLQSADISLAQVYRERGNLPADNANYLPDSTNKVIETVDRAQNTHGFLTDTVLWELKGQAYYQRGVQNNNSEDLLNAAECFEKVIEYGVPKKQIYINAAICYMDADDYTHAQSVLDALKEKDDGYEAYAYNSILLIAEQNAKPQEERDYNEAYSQYQEAVNRSGSADTELLDQLNGYIQQLKDGGWIQ